MTDNYLYRIPSILIYVTTPNKLIKMFNPDDDHVKHWNM